MTRSSSELLLGSNSFYVATAAAAALVIGWRVLTSPKVDQDKLPPAPANMGLIEYLTALLSSKGPQFALENARKIGYVSRTPGTFGRLMWITVGEPDLARRILDDPQSDKPFQAYQMFDKSISGENFFSSNGDRANHVRKSTAAAFSARSMKKMAVVVEEVLSKWIQERLEPIYVKPGKSIDIDEEMMMLTTDVIAQAGFDYPLSPEERMDFAEKMRKIMDVFFHQNLNIWRKFFGFAFSDIREARRIALELKHKIGHRLVQACRENPNPDKNSLIYLMTHDTNYVNDDQRARDILLYFFAGFETTAHSIAFTMLELAKNPDEQSKLRAALNDYVTQHATNGNKENQETPDIKLCPQLKYVTREVLRLHTPAALGSSRYTAQDIPVTNASSSNKKQMIIPKGSICSIIYYIILRNHKIFVEPDKFVPSRWENPTQDMNKAYLPFASGKRNCQGMALAYLELNTVVARLTQSYKIEVEDEGEEYYMVALRPKGSKLLLKKL